MKKGFTLIELLAVIAVLAIILLIAVPNIISVINDVKTNSYIKDEEMMIKAASNYMAVNQNLIPANLGDTIEITLATLKSSSMITNIVDPVSKTDCNGYVLITKIASGFDYTAHLKCGSSNTIGDSSTDKLIGHYKLDGNALDYSLYTNNGTIYGATNTSNRFNTNNSALSFAYTTDRIEINNPVNTQVADAVTFSVWIKSNDITKDQNIISRNGPYFLRIVGSKLRFNAYTNSTWLFAPGNITLESNKWYNLVYTYDNNYLKGYINGVLDIDSPKTTNFSAFSTFFIGYTTVGGENSPFDGIIDDVKIYGRALSQEEITMNYKVGIAKDY